MTENCSHYSGLTASTGEKNTETIVKAYFPHDAFHTVLNACGHKRTIGQQITVLLNEALSAKIPQQLAHYDSFGAW